MLRSDAKNGIDNFEGIDVDNVNISLIPDIQKDMTTYDLNSIVFLLYDTPSTALQSLTLLQRVHRDVGVMNLSLLLDWAANAQSRLTWKHEFLEALVTCQLFNIVRKLSLNVLDVKRFYAQDKTMRTNYINPMKKVLYELCENITSENLLKLRKCLSTYNIDTSTCENCELVFLQLMAQKFIRLPSSSDKECDIKNLASILEKLPGLATLAQKLRDTESEVNQVHPSNKNPIQSEQVTAIAADDDMKDITCSNFNEEFNMITNLIETQLSFLDLKADKTVNHNDVYEIKNPNRVGVCYIINQEFFYPSKLSIINHNNCHRLDDRQGSSCDKEELKSVMESLKLHVETSDNLEHQEILPKIQYVLEKIVRDDDSMFVLAIMSHGIEGHIYGADCVPVNVKDIQNLLDYHDTTKLRLKPKVLLIQACQTLRDKEPIKLLSDSPNTKSNYFLPKLDFLIYWATAPEYEAYRIDTLGSVFIHLLCKILLHCHDKEHLTEICTKVTNNVVEFCAKLKHAQIPIFHSTLRKKLYFQRPN